MKPIDELLLGKKLPVTQAERLFQTLLSEKKIDQELAKLILILLKIKGEQASELAGLVRVVRKLEKPLPHKYLPYLVDGCGTGGDGTDTFNISTIASVVAAGAGAQVAKHGNRSISSRCGSADLLEALGVKINAPPKRMTQALEEFGMGYYHAPLYHRAFKSLQNLRKDLIKQYKMRTIFNVIGPLVNPLQLRKQAIGVFREDLVRKVATALKLSGFSRALVFRSCDGMDELTTTDKTLLVELRNGKIKTRILTPTQLGFKRGKRKDLNGGNAKFNAKIATNILNNQDRSYTRRDVVLLNAAAILYVSGRAKNLRQGIALARRSIESGAAMRTLRQLKLLSHGS